MVEWSVVVVNRRWGELIGVEFNRVNKEFKILQDWLVKSQRPHNEDDHVATWQSQVAPPLDFKSTTGALLFST